MDECFICNGRKKLCTLVCGHKYCHSCLETWNCRSSTCPSCRKPLLIVSGATMNHKNTPMFVTKRMYLGNGSHAGLHMTNNSDTVLVKDFESFDAGARAGIKRGDVFLRMNSLKCHRHEDTAKALTLAAGMTDNVVVGVDIKSDTRGIRLYRLVSPFYRKLTRVACSRTRLGEAAQHVRV